jgi:hypothetical protein
MLTIGVTLCRKRGARMRKLLAAVIAAGMCLTASAGRAAVVEYVIVSSITAPYGTLPAGTPIEIVFRFDDAAPDAVPAILDTGAYDLLQIDVSAAGETATFSTVIPSTGSLNILNSSFDRLTLVGIGGATFATTGGSLGGAPVTHLQVDLVDASQAVFSDDGVPGPGLIATDFTSFAGLIDDGIAINQAPLGTLTSLSGSVLSDPPQVPALHPISTTMLVLIMVALGSIVRIPKHRRSRLEKLRLAPASVQL